MQTQPAQQHIAHGQSLGIARRLAYVVLTIVITFSTLLSTYIGNKSREILLEKQYDFATLLAENLNSNIYRRFTLPTLLGFGRIALRQTAQYERLDQIIQSAIHGLEVNDLRIFGYDNTITYSINKDELGQVEAASESVIKAGTGVEPLFTIDSHLPYWKAFFQIPFEPNSYILRTAYPLRMENRIQSSTDDGPILGVLEFTQDITVDIERAIRFQQLVIILTVTSASLLFFLLLLFIRRAERDIAVRIKSEQHLTHELHQSEKLASMGRVIASIAHEIRNPLGIIRSSAELLLKREAGKDPMTGKILQAIYDEARRLSQTVSDFLDYARPRQLKPGVVDVIATINKALVFLEPDLQQRQILVVKRHNEMHPLFVSGDSDLLYRAFYNIMSNALQAMSMTGTLTIDVEQQKTGGLAQVVVTFNDSGNGFAQEHLEHLLDPFFTTKDDGTGLGLPIVSSIILSHQGTLEFGNTEEGAQVRVTLPQIFPTTKESTQ